MSVNVHMAIRTTRTGQNALLSHLKALLTLQRFNHNLAEAGSQAQLDANVGSDSVSQQGRIEFSKWRKMDSRTLGITRSMISLPSWIVMKVLQSKGFEVYLVGGCVRDLLLNRIPKDFDLITTAALKQIRKQFHHSEIVGRRFPICRVHVKGSVIEVSSFETVAQHAEKKEKFLSSQMPMGCDKKDFTRWRNCMHRDFTINSLFFDPFVNKIYDYANGMMDIRSSKLRTLIPAELSFKEDCARILRCLRFAARLDLSFSKETEAAIRKLSPSITKLNKSRMIMELNYMLSYGAAESSLCLLRRFNMLDILLPVHAAYLAQRTSKQSGQSSTMLMKLFFQLDKLVTCDRPSDCILWVGLLAFHLGLLNQPQHALVVLTFASVLYHGNWKEGVKFARQNAQEPLSFVPEISEACEFISDDELAERVIQLASLVQDSIDTLTDEESLLETMARFPGLPCSGVVIVSKKMGNNVAELFHVLVHDVETFKKERHSFKINYSLLGKGNLCETRFVIGKIIMDTMGCGGVQRAEVNQEEKDDLHSVHPEQKADVFEENSHRAADLKKCPTLGKDDRGCNIPPSNCELKQESSTKQKLTGKKSKFSEERMPKNQEAIANKEPEEKAEKRKYLIDINKCLELAKKHQNSITKKHQNSITKCHLGREDRIEQMEGVLENKECHLDQHGVVTKKNNNSEKEEINTVGSRLRLSSLFK